MGWNIPLNMCKDTKKIYIVRNSRQLIEDVEKGYKYLITMDKMADILEYDFKAALDMSQVEDQFE